MRVLFLQIDVRWPDHERARKFITARGEANVCRCVGQKPTKSVEFDK